MRLRSARLTDDTLVSQIDDYVGELELDIAQILGLDPDEDVTVSAFLMNNSGQVVKALIQFAAAGPLYEITNATNDNATSVSIGRRDFVEGTRLLAGIFPGTGNSFSTAEGDGSINSTFAGFALLVGDGSPHWSIIGYTYTAAAAGLLPPGQGATVFYDGTGRLTTPGRPSESVLLTGATNSALVNNGFPVGDSVDLFWTTEDFDPQTLHAANDDEVIIETAGNYMVNAQVKVQIQGNLEAGTCSLKIFRDRAAADTQWGESDAKAELTDGANQLECDALIACNVGDKIYAQVTYTTESGNPDVYAVSSGYLGVSRIA